MPTPPKELLAKLMALTETQLKIYYLAKEIQTPTDEALRLAESNTWPTAK